MADTAQWGQPPDEPSNDDLTAMLNERWGEPSTAGTQEPVSPPDGSTEAPPVALPPEVEPPTTTPSFKLSDGVEIDEPTARRYHEFDQYLQEHPDVLATIQGIATGELTVSPTTGQVTPTIQEPKQPQLPEGVDPADPAIKFLLDRLAEADAKYGQLVQRVDTFEPQLQQQNLATSEAIVNRVSRSFQSDRNLTDEQMERLKQTASRMNVLAAYMSPVDTVTGLPRRVDPMAAVESALDAAYWQDPEFRDAEIARQLGQRKTDDERKRKLASLGGSSGSLPRTSPEPKTEAERKQAMIEELAPHFNT